MIFQKERYGYWTLKSHLVARHFLTSIGEYVSTLCDSNTLIPEQDNKTFKYTPTNGVHPGFYMANRVSLKKSINMALEENTEFSCPQGISWKRW